METAIDVHIRKKRKTSPRAHGLADQSQSIGNQRKVVMEYLRGSEELSGYSVLEFIDDGLTGTNTDRPQFQAMIQAARRGRVLMWSHATVLQILRNIKYTGSMANHMRENRYIRNRNQRRVPREDWIVTEGTHEAIVTREEYEAAQAQSRAVKKSARKPPESADRVFYCGHCGRKLRKSFGLDAYFACDTRLYQDGAACAGLRWSKRDLDAVLLPIYRAQLELMGERARNLQTAFQGRPKVNWENRLEKIGQEIARQNARKIQYYKEQCERRAVRRETEAYLWASAVSGEAFKASMYEAIERVTVFSNRHIEVRWKFEDLFAKLRGGERSAV